jgi:hypothetical protein
MKAKISSIAPILGLVVIIGIMSWRDMHPTAPSRAPLMPIAYYAGADAMPALVPEDSVPVIIYQGKISYTSDGKAVWTDTGMKPATFAQRQVNLRLQFTSLPKDLVETEEKIQSLATEWQHQGSAISIIFVDYRPANPDFTAYAAFLRALHAHFKEFNFGIVADESWLQEPLKSHVPELQDYVMTLVDLPAPAISPELFAQLEQFHFNAIMRFPAGVSNADVDKTIFEKLKYSSGFALTIDPHAPPVKKEEKVGLFPKF